MSYLKINDHTLNCNNIYKYIKKAEDANKEYWLSMGLTECDIKLLVELENNEQPISYPLGYYATRKYLLQVGKIDIDDVINDIEEYRLKLEEL